MSDKTSETCTLESTLPLRPGPAGKKEAKESESPIVGQTAESAPRVAFTRPPASLPGPENHPFFAGVAGWLSSPGMALPPQMPFPSPGQGEAQKPESSSTGYTEPSSNVPPPPFPSIQSLLCASPLSSIPTAVDAQNDDGGPAGRPTDAPDEHFWSMKSSAYAYRYRIPHGEPEGGFQDMEKEAHIQGFLWYGSSWRRNMWFVEVVATEGTAGATGSSPPPKEEIKT